MIKPSSPIVAMLAIVGVLASSSPLHAQRLLDWRNDDTTQAASTTATTVPPRASLDITGNGPIREIWVSNPLPGPAQLRVHGSLADGARTVPALPISVALRAGERRQLARIYPGPRGDTPARLALDVVPGSTHARADDTLYHLPFDGSVRIDQGFGGRFSHRDPANRHALDFALPVGTPILAARDGVVMEIQDSFVEGGDDATLAARANLVRILHADGSMAIYAHLAPDGVEVRSGQQVRAGERIGRSGNTGLSTAPHLHFAIQLNRGLQLVSVSFRIAGPLGELKFPQAVEAAP